MGEKVKLPREQSEPVEKQEQRLNYDDLTNVANQLQQQVMQKHKEVEYYKKELERIGMIEQMQILQYAFKVLEFKELFSKEFVVKTVAAIQSTLAPPESVGVSNEETGDEK